MSGAAFHHRLQYQHKLFCLISMSSVFKGENGLYFEPQLPALRWRFLNRDRRTLPTGRPVNVCSLCWRGESVTAAIQKDPGDAISWTKAFYKIRWMFSSSLKPKTHSLYKYNKSHGRVASSGASYRLWTGLAELYCLTLLFTPKIHATVTHHDFIWHLRVLFIIMCGAKIISRDGCSIHFCCRWWVYFEKWNVSLACFLTSSMYNLFPFSYASDVTSGLSDGYEGLSEKGEKTAARRTAGKLFRRRARSRLRITGVQ